MIKIIADTTSSIPLAEARRLGVEFLPQIIIFGEESYRDDCEIDSETFLQKLKMSAELPKTAAPHPFLYTPIYQQLAAGGDTGIILCPSGKVSGTVRSATVAAQDFPGVDIRVIDTQMVGGGLGRLVYKAVEWVDQGLDADTLVDRVEKMAARERVYFAVATLEYLHKGGRIGNAQALLGSLLQVKPILTLKSGQAEVAESQRTRKRSLARLKELIQEEYPHKEDAHLCVMHSGNIEEAGQFTEELKQQFGISEIPLYLVPPAIIVHIGPGVLAVSFFKDEES